MRCSPRPPPAVDIYAYANGCYALRDANTNRFVVRDALGYAATAPTAAAATPFRLQATALGSYLLYGPDARMPSAGALDPVSPTATPGPAADWRVTDGGGTLRLTNVSTGRDLGVGALGRLVQVSLDRPPLVVCTRAGLRDLPRGGGERQRASRPRGPARMRACAASSTTTSISAPSSSSAAGSIAGVPGARTE